MAKRILPIVALLSSFALASQVVAKEAEVSGMALQQIQGKDFETGTDILFPAIVTVLQDSGYRIEQANRDSGFISGIGSSEQKTTFNIWWGFGRSKSVPIVSAFIEQRGPRMSRARLNFVMAKFKSRNTYSDEKPITDPAVYRDAFERIEREVFVRQAMNAPAPVPVAAQPAAPAPAATATPAVDGAAQAAPPAGSDAANANTATTPAVAPKP